MALRVVFDTNVLFSALGWHGNPRLCLELVRGGSITGLTCGEILAELDEKLAAKLDFTEERRLEVITSLLATLEPVTISGGLVGPQSDRKDDMILECAVVGRASHIVTGDKKHLLPIGTFEGVEIVKPVDLLKLAERQNRT